jgi:hypothetical protein
MSPWKPVDQSWPGPESDCRLHGRSSDPSGRRKASTETTLTTPIGRAGAGPTGDARHGPASINRTEDASIRATGHCTVRSPPIRTGAGAERAILVKSPEGYPRRARRRVGAGSGQSTSALWVWFTANSRTWAPTSEGCHRGPGQRNSQHHCEFSIGQGATAVPDVVGPFRVRRRPGRPSGNTSAPPARRCP